jgi:PAS domain S-box-containing protein
MSVEESSGLPRKPPFGLALGICLVLVIGLAWLRLIHWPHQTSTVGFAVPLLVAAWGRNRKLLWSLVPIFAGMAIYKFSYLNVAPPGGRSEQTVRLCLAMADLLVVAWLADLLVRYQDRLEERSNELRATNEDLIDREKALETILNIVPFGVLIANADATVGRFNQAARQLLHVPPEMSGQAIGWAEVSEVLNDGKVWPTEQWPMMRALRGEQTPIENMHLKFHDGRNVHILISAAPLRDRSGKISAAVVAFVDVTELKKLQGELERRRREAEEASLRKSQFLAAASHDIRTPANALGLLAELLQRSASDPELAGEIPQLAKELQASANGLLSLVTDVLDLTRLDVGRVEMKVTDFDLGNWLNEECHKLQSLADQKKLLLKCHGPEMPIRMRCDHFKLSRIMTNLISNAIKYTDAGQIHVSCRRREDGGVDLTVQDTGVGIAREHQASIFDEFVQLKSPDRDLSKGTGLGLSISKRLIELLGGNLSVISELGKGSAFIASLPAGAVIG